MKKLLIHHLFSSLIVIAVSAVLYMMWRSNSPYPSVLNWDIWEHQIIVTIIRNGSFAVLPSALSDTFRFDGYTTLFHTIIAAFQTLTRSQNFLGFWWVAEGIFFTFTGLATYLLVFALTHKRSVAVTGAILSGCFFESTVAYTTLFLIPQTLVALIWVIGMAYVTSRTGSIHRIGAAILFSLIMVPMHAIIGAFASLLLIAYAFGLSFSHDDSRIGPLAWAAFGMLGYGVPSLIAHYYNLSGINAGEAQHFTQTIAQKLALLQQWYGFLPIPFLVVGLWRAAMSQKTAPKILVLFLSILVGFTASAFPYVLKFAVLTHYIMIGIMAIGIAWLIKSMKVKIARYVGLGIISAAAMVVFITNTNQWKNPIVFRGTASEVSSDEYQASLALKPTANAKTLLISDPSTQYVLEALSTVNSSGGAYMDRETRQHLVGALTAETKEDFITALSTINDQLPSVHHNVVLLTVSGRTIKWLDAKDKQLDISYNIWRPEALSLNDQIVIESWKQRYELTEVYRNPSVVIFEIRI